MAMMVLNAPHVKFLSPFSPHFQHLDLQVVSYFEDMHAPTNPSCKRWETQKALMHAMTLCQRRRKPFKLSYCNKGLYKYQPQYVFFPKQ